MRWRFLGSQLVHRRGRTLTLGVGILVAAASFSLLTAAASTSELRVRGAVARNWKTAYDILVRPTGSFTRLERERGLVRENYLSGIFGGITMRQYREIGRISGVQVAAPIANLGYILPFASGARISINKFLTRDPVQLYRLRLAWFADRRLSRYPGQTLYVYFTRRNRFSLSYGVPEELVPGRGIVPVCSGFGDALADAELLHPSPFASGNARAYLQCFSARSPRLVGRYYSPYPRGFVGSATNPSFPVAIAAVDPVEENRLLGLDLAITKGRPLSEEDRAQKRQAGIGFENVVPVILSQKTYVDQPLRVTVERLGIPPGSDVPRKLASSDAYRYMTRLSGQVVGTQNFSSQALYDDLLSQLTQGKPASVQGRWTVSPVTYETRREGPPTASPLSNPRSVWSSEQYESGFYPAPPGNDDVQFRDIVNHPSPYTGQEGSFFGTSVQIVGRFDPEKLPGFNALSRVPLESYYPPQVEPGDDRSRELLGDRALLPSSNLGGYVAQPPFILTTLDAAKAFTDPRFFKGGNRAAPVSVIRVRVKGANGPDAASRERVRRVAAAIHDRTGLAVDITAGSSPTPILVQLPAGRFGRPPLLLREGWVNKGVAVAFLTALDRKSLAVFLLVLVVCVLFLVNGALATVRARRAEIGTLLCLGWSRRSIFGAVLGELALVGLAAGLAGAGLAATLIAVLGLDLALWRAALVAPVAVVLAIVAGVAPAWLATRSAPLHAVRPPVSDRSGRVLPGLVGMAISNLRRLPVRTALAATGLFVGVASLAVLLSLQLAFQGLLTDTLLGEFISVQIRPVDYLSVGLAIALGGLAVADVLALNLRERAPEVVTLRASGWRESDVARLVALEGLGIGLLGGAAGGLIGLLVGGLLFTGPLARIAGLSALAALAGVAVAVVASLVPATIAARMSVPRVLAEE